MEPCDFQPRRVVGRGGGEAAVPVDPRSADEMAEALIKVETNAGSG